MLALLQRPHRTWVGFKFGAALFSSPVPLTVSTSNPPQSTAPRLLASTFVHVDCAMDLVSHLLWHHLPSRLSQYHCYLMTRASRRLFCVSSVEVCLARYLVIPQALFQLKPCLPAAPSIQNCDSYKWPWCWSHQFNYWVCVVFSSVVAMFGEWAWPCYLHRLVWLYDYHNRVGTHEARVHLCFFSRSIFGPKNGWTQYLS